ncbi:MAG: hypothetical protein ACO4CW_00085, partial [Planctomycetota bacterium]
GATARSPVTRIKARAMAAELAERGITLIDAIPNNVEFAVIGTVILIGVVTDESVRRVIARRRPEGRGSIP